MQCSTTFTFRHAKKISNEHLADALEIIAGEIRKRNKTRHRSANGGCQCEVT